MKPDIKRFNKKYQAAADAISRLDVDQETREKMAASQAEAFDGQPDFKRDLFEAIARDPLVACAGTPDGPCPFDREIRISMHLRDAPDGRSAAWRSDKPEIRCISCGARTFIPDYPPYSAEEIAREKAAEGA